MKKQLLVYQSRSGAIELKGDFEKENLWASLVQIAKLFETDKSGISRHIKNIYATKELSRRQTVAIFATVQKEGGKEVKRQIEYFNLDMILSIGYRVNSKKATVFRQWATKTLRKHITDGYTLNKSRLATNYNTFLKAVDQVKLLLPSDHTVKSDEALELVKMFAKTWISLDAYDRMLLPNKGINKKKVGIATVELEKAIESLKNDLILKKEASELFASPKTTGALAGIVGAVFQTFDGQDLYRTVEEKAAHLLYFIIKNHPFNDGNKRSGAFAFVWFLQRAGNLDTRKITPEALTALALLVAESKSGDKDKMVGLIIMLLGVNK